MRDTAEKAFLAFVGVFVAVFLVSLIVGVTPNNGSQATENAPEVADIENEQYDLGQYNVDETPGQATVRMDSTGESKTVLVHAGRGVTQRDFQPLANALVRNGHELRVLSEGPALTTTIGGIEIQQPQRRPDEEVTITGELGDVDGLLVVGVEKYNDEELDALGEFVADDGRIAVLTEPRDAFDPDEGATELQSMLGVFGRPGYVYNLAENDLNYQRIFVEQRDTDSLTDGVDRAVFDTATPVGTEAGTEPLAPIDNSRLSTTRAGTDAPVLVRNDDAALAGDTDFMSPTNVLRADNDELVGNLADFLVTGNRSSGDGESGDVDGDLEAVATGGFLTVRADSEQQARQTRRGTVEIPDGGLQITAAVDGTSWESTGVETTSSGGSSSPVELTAPDGLSGRIDVANDTLTVEGTVVLETASEPLQFDISATTGESGALTGSADLGADGGTATVVDNTFTIPDTGETALDDALGLPTESGQSWLELSFELTLAPGAAGTSAAEGSASGTEGTGQ